MTRQPIELWGKYLQVMYLVRVLYPENRKNSYNFTIKRQSNLKMGEDFWSLFPKYTNSQQKQEKRLNIIGLLGNANQNHVFTPTGVAKSKTTTQCRWGCGETGTLPRCWRGRGCKMVQSLGKTVWQVLSKLSIELPFDPATIRTRIHTKEWKQRFKQVLVHKLTAALPAVREQ